MSVVEALILGMVQGLTEFLPVSSSGHIQIAAFLFNINPSENLLFTLLVHTATVISIIIVFYKYIISIIKGLFEFRWNDETRLTVNLIISMVPIGIIGIFFESYIEVFFEGRILFVSAMLIITGILLTTTYLFQHAAGNSNITPFKALLIGVAQAVAVLPGISRSGATIATGLLLGVNKEKATSFSFVMVIVPILGAALLKFGHLAGQPVVATQLSPVVMATGFLSALIFGIFACRWMIDIVKKGKLIYFAFYCFLIAFSVIVIEWVK